jgi:hypothetical protein
MSARFKSSYGSDGGSCSCSDNSPSGASCSAPSDCLKADLERCMGGFTLKGPNSGFCFKSLQEDLD